MDFIFFNYVLIVGEDLLLRAKEIWIGSLVRWDVGHKIHLT